MVTFEYTCIVCRKIYQTKMKRNYKTCNLKCQNMQNRNWKTVNGKRVNKIWQGVM